MAELKWATTQVKSGWRRVLVRLGCQGHRGDLKMPYYDFLDPRKQLQVENRMDFKHSSWRQRFRQGPAGWWNPLRGQMCAHVHRSLQKFQGLSKRAPERGRSVDWGAGLIDTWPFWDAVASRVRGNGAPDAFLYHCFGEPYKRSALSPTLSECREVKDT